MKIKNKKLFALLMLPAVIAMMVLPLCSFTTTTAPEYESYEPIIRKDVGYVYQTSSNTYYGSISNYNKVLAPIGDLTSQTIKTNASSYLIITSPSMRINYVSFSNGSSIDYVDGEDFLTLKMDCSGGNDTNKLYFNGVVDYYGCITIDSSGKEYIVFDSSSITSKNYACRGYAEYLMIDNFDIITTHYYEFEYYFEDADNVLPLVYLVNNIYSSIPTTDDGRLYVTHIRCEYLNQSGDSYNPIHSSRFSYSNPIYLSSVKSAYELDYMYDLAYDHMYDTIYDNVVDNVYDNAYSDGYFEGNEAGKASGYGDGYYVGYQEGYDLGYNEGSIGIRAAWGSFGDFLTDVVGSFFSFEFWDGFSLGGVMAIIVGAMLFVAFLKVFAGG